MLGNMDEISIKKELAKTITEDPKTCRKNQYLTPPIAIGAACPRFPEALGVGPLTIRRLQL